MSQYNIYQQYNLLFPVVIVVAYKPAVSVTDGGNEPTNIITLHFFQIN